MQHLNLTRIAVPDLPQENTVGIMADATPPMGLTRFAAAVSGGDPIKTGVIQDQALQAILVTQVDLVVMASHAPDQIREFLADFGADRIVRRSLASVLVVRA